MSQRVKKKAKRQTRPIDGSVNQPGEVKNLLPDSAQMESIPHPEATSPQNGHSDSQTIQNATYAELRKTLSSYDGPISVTVVLGRQSKTFHFRSAKHQDTFLFLWKSHQVAFQHSLNIRMTIRRSNE